MSTEQSKTINVYQQRKRNVENFEKFTAEIEGLKYKYKINSNTGKKTYQTSYNNIQDVIKPKYFNSSHGGVQNINFGTKETRIDRYKDINVDYPKDDHILSTRRSGLVIHPGTDQEGNPEIIKVNTDNKKTKLKDYYKLDLMLQKEVPISVGNYNEEISINLGVGTQDEYDFGLKNRDLYKSIDYLNKNTNYADTAKGEALSIIGTIGTFAGGAALLSPAPFGLAVLSAGSTLDTIISTRKTASVEKKAELLYSNFLRAAQSDAFKTISVGEDGRLKIKEYQNIDGALLLNRETVYKTKLRKNSNGEYDYKDFVVPKKSNDDFSMIYSDESYHYELTETGDFQVKYKRYLDKKNIGDTKRDYELEIYDEQKGKLVELNPKDKDNVKYAMNIFEAYDNGYNVFEQLEKIY